MSVPVSQTNFIVGEVTPSLFGHTDLARMKSAASTMRNMFPSYQGGAYSRAGTEFVGFSRQTGRSYPPRLITFQFSINQGLALEFGNFYMRVISDGGFVTEQSGGISGISQANPGVVTYGTGVVSATARYEATASYAPGNTVTLAGGTFTTAAVLTVTNTRLKSTTINAIGSGYAPGDIINLAGGTQTTQSQLNVIATQIISVTLNNGGTPPGGGAPVIPDGVHQVIGTGGSGTRFRASVNTVGGTITVINSITFAGSYTANPPAIDTVVYYNEPGFGINGALFNITAQGALNAISVHTPGVFTANPGGGAFTQLSTTGAGTGATFQSSIMAPNAVSITTPGAYTVYPTNPVGQSATSGTGTGAQFDITGQTSYVNGDWIFISGVNGMTEVNGLTVVVAGATASSFQMKDVYGNNINTTSMGVYTSGGTVARIYTVTSPYAEQDLKWLKFTQSADVMSLCCVNQDTNTEYPPYDLIRNDSADWSFDVVDPTATIGPPASGSGSASAAGSVNYQYCVTAVNPDDGSESVRSPIISINSAVNIAATAGTISLNWAPVAGVNQYNVYKATPGFNTSPPVGALFGFAGFAYGTQFIDSNIVSDFAQVPPRHENPFARGQIVAVPIVTPGSGYTAAQVVVSTATGTGAVFEAVIVGGQVVAVIVDDNGKNYGENDTVNITGDGTGATATLTLGAQSGTFPAVPSYFQQRRVYGYTLNNPDTYFMSQQGSFTNFDSRIPTLDTDAIIGSPWSVQVNGIQFMLPMPGGLVILTGLSAWQLTGAGGSSLNPQPLTPSTQQAQPQAYNGCSPTVPPIKIDYDIVYVQAKGSIYRSFAYQFQTNIYTGIDLTLNSSHMFKNFTTIEHAWCEEPYKILWSVRNDGVMLSLTYLKPQEVVGWARHDTAGFFESVCSATEPPVDALYVAVQRFIGVNTAYTIERMNNRLWTNVEDAWCVDCGSSLAQPAPNATLSCNDALGLGSVTGATNIIGGSNYSTSTTVSVVDAEGNGSGATAQIAIVAGQVVNIIAASTGANYTQPSFIIDDPSRNGSGASADPVLFNGVIFSADAAVFAPGDVGKIIRSGGGIARIISYDAPTQVSADILSPIVDVIPGTRIPRPQPAGSWTMSTPVTTVGGLRYLAGATVTGLADGNVVPPVVVPATGVVPLPAAASAVTLGLAFKPQLQSIYLIAGEPTTQGQRKKISAVTLRIEESRGLKVGTNQPDGSTLSPPQIAPTWSNLSDVPDNGPNFPLAPYNALATPLRTGDIRVPVKGGYGTPGQVAIQQDNPLPMQVLAIIDEVFPGDTPELKRERRRSEA